MQQKVTQVSKITFTIDGREALPVRAIPYVADWEKASPEWLTHHMEQGEDVARGVIPLTAYQLLDDIPAAVLPREWKIPAEKVKGVVQVLREQRQHLQPSDDHAGYVDYQVGAIDALPHSVFVWLDEFICTYQNHCERNHLGVDTLTLAPMEFKNDQVRARVLHGFVRRVHASNNPEPTGQNAEEHMQSAFDETGLNGTSINWRYWVEQMPALTAIQAACLMSALEPDNFSNLNERPGKDDPAQNIDKARKIHRLAEAHGKLTAAPDEWLRWARSLNIKVHIGFVLAVSELPDTMQKVGTGGAAASLAAPSSTEQIVGAINPLTGRPIESAHEGAPMMTNNEIETRLILLARDRLQSIPGAFSLLQNGIKQLMQGISMREMACEMPHGTTLVVSVSNADAVRALDTHLVQIIDKWAETCPITPPSVEPLPISVNSAPDVDGERGCRRLILENWLTIKSLHGVNADARQVLRVIKRYLQDGEKHPELKTVQNKLIDLRKEKKLP
jgi:hypothetical protein